MEHMDLTTHLRKYNLKRVFKHVTEDEHKEIFELVVALSDLCNSKIPLLVKKLRLNSLKKFTIMIGGISLEFGCDDGVYDEMLSREEKPDIDIDYIG